MDMRHQRGLEMAAKFKIVMKSDGTWSVPSQSASGERYRVEMGDSPKCSCPYQETHGRACKHIFAVEYFLQRELNGAKVGTEDVFVPNQPSGRKTYRQNWPAYNAAQTSEKTEFQRLLQALCADLESLSKQKDVPEFL